ncbi:DUF2812 domain-containing protein [Priestia taiwanensis]|uniref:DUF2812 domain-containing protein n=1 Tax=Priestia taiwanensis TaxID=1347902 RepID=A0A917EQR9_9BACI|nr:DUF2812 domain-containing protein [Priestia taiwanensis]MBM7363780.1 hypothetical protein [Priestia taiwanensis]GGE74137.1 hypothetical protein GCM10007140_25060 [Priestia taiwanensis]
MGEKRVFKHFFIWETEKEEKLLTRMLAQGLELYDYNMVCYTFKQTTSRNMMYKIDHKEDSANIGEYISLYEACGWEYVTMFGDKYYFRCEANAEEPVIYSENETKIEKMTYMWKMLFRSYIVIFLSSLTILFGTVFGDSFVMKGFVVLFNLFYISYFARLAYEIRKGKKEAL